MKRLGRNGVFAVAILGAVWLILNGGFNVWTAAAAVAVGAGCIFFCRRYFATDILAGFSLLRLVAYPFYLILQIYLSGLAAIKLIITGATAETVEVKTQLNDRFLRVLLANSITLTPGTISLDISGDVITVLRLKGKNAPDLTDEEAGAVIKGRLERRLLKVQKREGA